MSDLSEYVRASDPDHLTTAVFVMPSEGHAVHGRFAPDITPTWPADHKPDASCPCRPVVYWDSAIAPRPMYEHRG